MGTSAGGSLITEYAPAGGGKIEQIIYTVYGTEGSFLIQKFNVIITGPGNAGRII